MISRDSPFPSLDQLTGLLGDNAQNLQGHPCQTICKEALHLPSPDHIDQAWKGSNRNNKVLVYLQHPILPHTRKGPEAHT